MQKTCSALSGLFGSLIRTQGLRPGLFCPAPSGLEMSFATETSYNQAAFGVLQPWDDLCYRKRYRDVLSCFNPDGDTQFMD